MGSPTNWQQHAACRDTSPDSVRRVLKLRDQQQEAAA